MISLVFAAGYWHMRLPSLESVREQTALDPGREFVQYGEIRYATSWGPEVSFAGQVRDIARARFRDVPMITHDVVVTTGDFSDPARVSCSPLHNGSIVWRSEVRPQGELHVLHVLPASEAAFEALVELEPGAEVTLVGHEEADNKIEGSDGSWQRFARTKKHVLFLVTGILP